MKRACKTKSGFKVGERTEEKKRRTSLAQATQCGKSQRPIGYVQNKVLFWRNFRNFTYPLE